MQKEEKREETRTKMSEEGRSENKRVKEKQK